MRKAEEPHSSNQRHESLPWPLPVLSQENPGPMGQGWHPHYGATGVALWVTSLTKWVHCPGSWDLGMQGKTILGLCTTYYAG